VRSFLTSLFKDAPIIAIVAVVAFVAAVLASQLKPAVYTASASLLVLGSDEYASRPATLTPQAVQPAALMNRDAILSSEISILSSYPVLRAAVDKMGVQALYPEVAAGTPAGVLGRLLGTSPDETPQQRAAALFASNLKVKADRSGSTIHLSYSHTDPSVASAAVNALIAAYQARRQSIYSSTESEVVQTTVRQSREQLDSVSEQLAQFQASNGISNYETQMDLLLRRMSEQTRMLQAAQTEAAELEKKIGSLRQQLESAPRDVVQYQDTDPDRRVLRLQESVAELHRQEADLLQTYTEQSDRVTAVRRQIQALEQRIAGVAGASVPTGVRRGVNEVHTAIELELVRASSQAKAVNQRRQGLSEQAVAIQSEIRTMQERGARLHDLSRKKSLAEQAFINATKALEERRNMEDLGARRAANVRTIEAADAPAQPDRIRLIILLAGGFFSLVAAFATALVLHRFRGTYLDGSSLHRETGLPLLGTMMESIKPLSGPRLPGARPETQ
jgi:uncharacterized protein involved in exopolysaccharide biosynthesis